MTKAGDKLIKAAKEAVEIAKNHQTMNLYPCPFCGAGETAIHEQHLSPRMEGPGALIAVTIRHHCSPRIEGAVAEYREVRGRDHKSAEAAYNRRPK